MSTDAIDTSARIHPSARLAPDVMVGPWSIIGENVQIGAGSILDSHVIVRRNTRIGSNNRFLQFCSVGEDPADQKFQGEETWLEIGDHNVFREGVTLHRGTGAGGGLTTIGCHNLLMAYVHVAHDCRVGSHTVLANNVGLCGHVTIADWAILGGYAGVNQFLTVGAHAMVGGMTHVTNDVPAYLIVNGQPATARSVNVIGLERRGFDSATIATIREAFKIIYKRNYSLQEAIRQLQEMTARCEALDLLVQSLESSTRGIHR